MSWELFKKDLVKRMDRKLKSLYKPIKKKKKIKYKNISKNIVVRDASRCKYFSYCTCKFFDNGTLCGYMDGKLKCLLNPPLIINYTRDDKHENRKNV